MKKVDFKEGGRFVKMKDKADQTFSLDSSLRRGQVAWVAFQTEILRPKKKKEKKFFFTFLFSNKNKVSITLLLFHGW